MRCSHAQLEYLAGLTQQKVHREEHVRNYFLIMYWFLQRSCEAVVLSSQVIIFCLQLK